MPFVDVINTMLDESLPLTVGEFEEWGNPKEKAAYDYMQSLLPLHNLERKAYPAMLVKTSFNDSQVMYWEPAKYVAKLRDAQDRREPAAAQDQHGRRARRGLGPLRLPARGGLRLRLRPRPDGPRRRRPAAALGGRVEARASFATPCRLIDAPEPSRMPSSMTSGPA